MNKKQRNLLLGIKGFIGYSLKYNLSFDQVIFNIFHDCSGDLKDKFFEPRTSRFIKLKGQKL